MKETTVSPAEAQAMAGPTRFRRARAAARRAGGLLWAMVPEPPGCAGHLLLALAAFLAVGRDWRAAAAVCCATLVLSFSSLLLSRRTGSRRARQPATEAGGPLAFQQAMNSAAKRLGFGMDEEPDRAAPPEPDDAAHWIDTGPEEPQA